ncbi:MAG: hypothetical protein VR68_04370 [Peptococcaceae bacterium BRH_c4a]|nr:MAG: hypothetical protein VR68_04370 [Peptococcaceae bacterium BRH_c4a]
MLDTKKYFYCIALTKEQRVFNIPGMDGTSRVYTVNYNDLAAVVSDSSAERYSLSRQNLLAHQKVLEEVMKGFVLLPVKFGTQAENVEDILKVLTKRYAEFKQSLEYFTGKNQMSLKVMWTDMSGVYREITNSDPNIKKFLEEARAGRVSSRNDLIEIGQYVEQKLTEKKDTEREHVARGLKKYARLVNIKDNYGDAMFVNADFLIDQDKQELFDGQLNQIAQLYGSSAYFKYIGPMPPYDFIQIFVD